MRAPSTREPRLPTNPLVLFGQWFGKATRTSDLEMAEAMCLSTVNRKGHPSARMLLLKDFGARGFTFFTNINSPKADDLLARPRAAMTFYWRGLRRQIRIEGRVKRLPKKVADDYFATRPRISQIGSWASKQSHPLESRAVLLKRVKEFEQRFDGRKIPSPDHWQGFALQPERIEFWQEGPYRLHDRWLYDRNSAGRWTMKRLYP
jgi:pyridoxamine 5'-phosphate oxidase